MNFKQTSSTIQLNKIVNSSTELRRLHNQSHMDKYLWADAYSNRITLKTIFAHASSSKWNGNELFNSEKLLISTIFVFVAFYSTPCIANGIVVCGVGFSIRWLDAKLRMLSNATLNSRNAHD